MAPPLTAGERLGAPPRVPGRGAPPREPGRPDGQKPARKEPPKRRRAGWFGKLVGTLMAVVVLVGAVGAMGLYGAYVRFSADLPDLAGLRDYQPRVMSRVYTGDSRLLTELATERRIFVPYSAIPELVKHAFISAEDQNFFTHRGVDPAAIIRAGVTDLMQYGHGKRPIGASTITQQVAKNMLVGNEVSLSRKVREAILAIRIEESLSKERILELYLNEIYLGLQSYGVASAAQAYFNKSLDELTLPEAAFLAALPKAPNNYNPFRFPDAAKARRDMVLNRMAEDHVVTAEQAAAARATPVNPSPFSRPETVVGGEYFAEEVRRELIDKFGAEQSTQGGLAVRTTVDPALQAVADRVLRAGLMKYDQSHGGWRGAVSHVEANAALRNGWTTAITQTAPPPGMLAEWRLAVVLDETAGEAHLGVIEPAAQGAAQGAGSPKVLPMQLSDVGWARPARDGRLGASPRRMADVVQPGDIVMAEIVPSTPGVGKAAGRGERLLLRQIPQVEGALVSMDPATGRVLALSGGWSFEMSQFNRATQALRQPGSSFKPYVYLTAMEQDISPSQRFLDAPFVLDQGAAGKWRPNNYEMDFNGPVPLRVALEKSLNLVTVRVADRVGMEAVAQTAIGFHVVDNMPRVLPAALGAVETTVLRQAGGYSGLDSGGREVIPTLIDSVQDRDGHVIWRAGGPDCTGCDSRDKPPLIADNRKQVSDAPSAFQVVGMMQGVVQRGTGYSAGVGLNRAIAGKTGTSQDFNDAWFGGFTPDLVTIVWIGFDNPSTLGDNETGSAVAAPVWHDFMAIALKNRPNLKFIPPPGVTMASWDSGSGMVTDAFKPGQTPGASGPLGGGQASADASPTSGTSPHAAGVDSGLGGLY